MKFSRAFQIQSILMFSSIEIIKAYSSNGNLKNTSVIIGFSLKVQISRNKTLSLEDFLETRVVHF